MNQLTPVSLAQRRTHMPSLDRIISRLFHAFISVIHGKWEAISKVLLMAWKACLSKPSAAGRWQPVARSRWTRVWITENDLPRQGGVPGNELTWNESAPKYHLEILTAWQGIR